MRIAADVPAEHKEALERHAQANDRRLADEIRRAVRMYVTMLERGTNVQPAAASSSPATPAPTLGA